MGFCFDFFFFLDLSFLDSFDRFFLDILGSSMLIELKLLLGVCDGKKLLPLFIVLSIAKSGVLDILPTPPLFLASNGLDLAKLPFNGMDVTTPRLGLLLTGNGSAITLPFTLLTVTPILTHCTCWTKHI